MTGTNADREKRHEQVEATRLTGMLNALVLLATAAVAYTDFIVVPDVSLGYLYVLPIALSALVNPVPFTLALVAICTFLQAIYYPPAPVSLEVKILRDAITLAGFLLVAFVVML